MLQVQSVRNHAGAVPWFEEAQPELPVWTMILMGYGRCVYWTGELKWILEQGDVLLIPPGCAFYGKSIPSVSHETYIATFTADTAAASAFPFSFKDTTHPQHIRPGAWDLLLARTQAMTAEWDERQLHYDAMCAAQLAAILILLAREQARGPLSSATARHVEQMKAYIKNHYREHVTKMHVGAVIDKSPNYAATLFKRATGQTISDYVHTLRIKTAVYLLSHSRLTVADIAESLGYCDASYFHRVFKKTTGALPSDYIKERETPVH